MAFAAQFDGELKGLFDRRVDWVRRAVGNVGPGPRPQFSRRKIQPSINRLEALARAILIRSRGRREFNRSVEGRLRWHPKRGKGWGISAKRKVFSKWYDEHVGRENCVYAFWSNGRCEYVGRTVRGRGRPRGHFEKFWFPAVTRITIFPVRLTSEVPKVECLAIDMFEPRRNSYAASKRKYAKKCPVCNQARDIRAELKTIFRLR